MQLVPLASALLLTMSTSGSGTAPPTAHRTLPPPIPTRQTVFSIPFQIERAPHPANAPAEIRLYVSADQGASWQIYDRVRPEQGRFLFRAAADGQYWFIIRTLDRSGQLRPQRVDGPGLRVLVDTTPPQLELDAQQEQAGQITLQWRAADPYLDPDSLKIQYRSGPMQSWQTVAIDRRRIQTSGATRSGEVIWWPESASTPVEIRAEVADAAGNLAVSHAKVDLNGQTVADSRPPGDAGRSGLPQTAASPWRPSTDALPARPRQGDLPYVPPTPHGNGTAAKQPNRYFASDKVLPNGRVYNQYAQNDQYAENADPNQLYPEAGYAGARYESRTRTADPGTSRGSLSQSLGKPADEAGRGGPARNATPPADSPSAIASDPRAWPPEGAVAANIRPPIQNQYAGSEQMTGGTSGYGLPTGERPQMLNTRLFELEYHLDSVGLSSVGRVELWGTRDGGRTWTSFGIDPDGQSPILVAVEKEGLYGFRIVVQSGAALGSQKPESGELPDVWIGVDLTKPSARILSAEPAAGDQAGQLLIRWHADDRMLAARPVSLSFSGNGGGPWTTIATDLENTGQYCWPVDQRLPPQIYLRLEVRDEAGNVASFETSEAVPLDAFRPTARIRGAHPVADAARTSSRRYRPLNQ